jgi:hypothetical protein
VDKQSRLWKVEYKRRLLLILMQEFVGSRPYFLATEALRRNTLWPKQDFAVLLLGLGASQSIISAIGGTVPSVIIHIQIEKDGLLQLGAYDRFHRQCIFFGAAVKEKVIESLVSENIMRPYTDRPPTGERKTKLANRALAGHSHSRFGEDAFVVSLVDGDDVVGAEFFLGVNPGDLAHFAATV